MKHGPAPKIPGGIIIDAVALLAQQHQTWLAKLVKVESYYMGDEGHSSQNNTVCW